MQQEEGQYRRRLKMPQLPTQLLREKKKLQLLKLIRVKITLIRSDYSIIIFYY